jgi:hypothetical protein
LNRSQPPVDVFQASPIVFGHGRGHGHVLPSSRQPRAFANSATLPEVIVVTLVAAPDS